MMKTLHTPDNGLDFTWKMKKTWFVSFNVKRASHQNAYNGIMLCYPSQCIASWWALILDALECGNGLLERLKDIFTRFRLSAPKKEGERENIIFFYG